MAVSTQPTLSPCMSFRIAEATALSPSSFRKRSEREGSKDEGHDSKDEGPGLEEEAAPEGQQHAFPVEDKALDEPLGLGYGALRHQHEGAERISAFRQPTLVTRVDPEDGRVYTDILTYVPPVAPIQTPPSSEWSFSSLPVSLSSPAVPTLVASPVTTPTTTIAVDEDEFLEVGAQLELHESILHDHTQRLDALPPTLFEGYDRDLRELYTRSGARAALRHAIYDTQRENHDLRMQIAKERRERLELTDCVARMERRHESRGE
ncbi:hypothetical protein Tco_0223155 [Tanacetum coccineum]